MILVACGCMPTSNFTAFVYCLFRERLTGRCDVLLDCFRGGFGDLPCWLVPVFNGNLAVCDYLCHDQCLSFSITVIAHVPMAILRTL